MTKQWAHGVSRDRTIPECENLPWDRRFHFYNHASLAWDDGDYVMTKEHGKVRLDLSINKFVIEDE